MFMDDRRSKEYRGSQQKTDSRKIHLLVVLSVIILILPVLFLLWLKVHFAYNEGYDSPEKLMVVFQQCESDFENAKLVFAQLPEHAIEGAEDYSCNTIIRSADCSVSSDSNTHKRNLVQRTYKTLSIASPIPYTESEYEQIYSAANPLFQKLSLDRIIIFPDRKQVYFVVFDDNRELVGHADVIMYDANTEVLESNVLDEYIAALISQRQPVVLEMIKKGWIVFSQAET